jgi:hypothetical protein
MHALCLPAEPAKQFPGVSMSRLSALLVFVLCFAIPAHADEASRRAKAGEILDLLRLSRASTKMLDGILTQIATITTQRAGGTLTPEMQTALTDFQKKVSAAMDPQVSWKVIEPEYIQRYADTFTDEELDGMIAFYKSPAGAAALEKVPAINLQVSQLVQTRVAALQPQINQMLNDFEKTIPDKGAPAHPPIAPAPGATSAPPAPPAPAPAGGKSSPQ